MNPLFEWTPTRIAKLTAMWNAGKTAQMIGDAIGASKNAVVGKANRLGLEPHVVLDPATAAKRLASRAAKDASVAPLALATCRFPLWGHDERPTMQFCQEKRIDGSSYCASHHAVCTRRATLHEVVRMPGRR